jgi:hypothetical protein
MKLAAIYNTWGDEDLLKKSIDNILPVVDLVIVVYSSTSNFGEKLPSKGECIMIWTNEPVFFKRMEPDLKKTARQNETAKRNYGLEVARELGATHFLTMDADEFYERETFLKDKERFHVESELQGLIATCTTYFKSPTLSIGLDITMVPFIHKLTPTIKHEFNRRYPFAWEGRSIRVDPTRSLNIDTGVHLAESTMHHMSWVRSDINRKIRNSSAKTNLERSTVLTDYVQAKEGYYCQFYGKVLTRVPNRFNIPEVWTSLKQ